MNLCYRPRDLSGDEIFTPPWTLVIEQYTVASVHVVRFSVINDDPVAVYFGTCCNYTWHVYNLLQQLCHKKNGTVSD